ncbi:MAG: hypothetical protein OSB41_05400 [Kiritimatiellae bacterium]|nr:hypothetical protein [Kiritimatiellia bacterium]
MRALKISKLTIVAAFMVATAGISAAADTSTVMYVGKRSEGENPAKRLIVFIDLVDSSKTITFDLKTFKDRSDPNIQNILKVIAALPHRAAGTQVGTKGGFQECKTRLVLTIPAVRPDLNTQDWRIRELNLRPQE